MSIVLWLVVIIAILYVLGLVAVAYLFVYPFRTPIFISPGFLGSPQESVEFKDLGTGRLLRGWLVPHESPSIVVVAGHGYMMNRAELAPLAARFATLPIAFLFYDFPAHGSSQGRRSGFGVRERTADASAVAFARSRYPSAKIVLMGSSMGSAASAFALAEDPSLADGLILDSCYDRLVDALSGWWLFIGGRTLRYLLTPAALFGMPMARVNAYQVVVSRALAKVSVPTLVLHGKCDTLAPVSHAESNLAALQGEKRLVVFEDCDHSEARWEQPERYFGEVEEFLKKFL